MPLKTFEHVLILANDLEKTKDFYVDLLGLTNGYRPDFPFPGYWLYLSQNEKAACIHLAMRKQGDGQDYYIGKKDDVKSGSGAIDHVAFNADNIEEMKEYSDQTHLHREWMSYVYEKDGRYHLGKPSYGDESRIEVNPSQKAKDTRPSSS